MENAKEKKILESTKAEAESKLNEATKDLNAQKQIEAELRTQIRKMEKNVNDQQKNVNQLQQNLLQEIEECKKKATEYQIKSESSANEILHLQSQINVLQRSQLSEINENVNKNGDLVHIDFLSNELASTKLQLEQSNLKIKNFELNFERLQNENQILKKQIEISNIMHVHQNDENGQVVQNSNLVNEQLSNTINNNQTEIFSNFKNSNDFLIINDELDKIKQERDDLLQELVRFLHITNKLVTF